MPTYSSSREGEFQSRKRSFVSPDHMIHFLNTATDDSWSPFKRLATEYATNKRTPPKRLNLSHVHMVATQKPRELVQPIENEFNSHIDPERESLLADGVADTVHTLGHVIGHSLGFDRLVDRIPTRT